MVVSLDIPAIDNGVPHAFAPDIHAAADHARAARRRRVESRSVDAVRDPVVFPREIVKPLRDVAGKNHGRVWRHGRSSLFDRESRGLFSRGKIVLEHQILVIIMVLLGLEVGALRRHDRPGRVLYQQMVK